MSYNIAFAHHVDNFLEASVSEMLVLCPSINHFIRFLSTLNELQSTLAKHFELLVLETLIFNFKIGLDFKIRLDLRVCFDGAG